MTYSSTSDLSSTIDPSGQKDVTNSYGVTKSSFQALNPQIVAFNGAPTAAQTLRTLVANYDASHTVTFTFPADMYNYGSVTTSGRGSFSGSATQDAISTVPVQNGSLYDWFDASVSCTGSQGVQSLGFCVAFRSNQAVAAGEVLYTLSDASTETVTLPALGGSGNPEYVFIGYTAPSGKTITRVQAARTSAAGGGYVSIDDLSFVMSPDTTAPATIANLAAGSPTSSSLTLTWTAPGDDGSTGTASTYDIRYSTSTINEGNWASATPVSGEPTPAAAGTNQNMVVSGLSASTTYYFAIKTADEVPNWSGMATASGQTSSAGISPAGVVDTTTKGTWKTVYGSDGYILAAFTGPVGEGGTDSSSLPSYISSYSVSGLSRYHWATDTSDPYDLQQPSGSLRNIGCWYTATSGTITLVPSQSRTFQLRVYLRDQDNYGRWDDLSFSGAGLTGTDTLECTAGKWITYTVTATVGTNVVLTLGRQAGANGTISALLFDPIPDITAPAAIANLATGSPTSSSLTLTWTAPGDDGSTGTASSYDIRYSTSAIDDSNWASATPVTGEPTPQAAGSNETMTVSGLNAATTYYFAIKTSDEASNPSAISNSPSGQTVSVGISPAGVVDATTKGTWKTVYGSDGYILAAFTGPVGEGGTDSSSLPSYISSYTVNGLSRYHWTTDSSDPYDLQQPSGSLRNIGCWYTFTSGTITLVPSQSRTFQLRVYLRDQDNGARWDNLSFTGAGLTGMDTLECTAGKWITYTVTATAGTNVVLNLQRQAGVNGIINALLFDPVAGGDNTAPAAITNLAAGSPTSSSLTLTWTAPGDDGSTGTATSYDIRYSTSVINASNWASATPVAGEPTPTAAGTQQTMTVSSLSAHTIYYFAIKTTDDASNTSALSNSPAGGTVGGTNAATFVSQSVPSSMTAGQTYTVSVTMHNSGTNPWSEAAEHRLGSQNPGDNTTWGMGRVLLVADEVVASGQDKTFSWTVTAPSTPGTYNFQWKMVQDWVEWFGSTSTNVVVTVSSGGTDTTAPAAITNLATGSPTSSSITLTWTAPGDDGSTGTANSYDIRYRTGGAIDASNWATATPCTSEPTPLAVGNTQSFVVNGLASSTTYYFAIKTADEIPNWSNLSNSPSGTTSAGGSSTVVALKRNTGLQAGWEDTRFAGATVVTTTVEDALMYIVQHSRWYNGGTATSSSGGNEFGFYRFDLSSIPPYAHINFAQLRVYHNNDNAAPTEASMVLTHDWLEGTTNWTFPGASGGLTWWAPMAYNTGIYQNPSGGSSEPYGGWGPNSDSNFDASIDAGLPVYPSTGGTWGWGGHVWDVTSHVQTWVKGVYPNLGWVLGPHGQNFQFSEADSDYRPVLFIDYSLEGDMTPPATLTNLTATNPTNRSVQLNWTAPGDDGSTGTATSYEIRYATSPITAASWVLATPATVVPTPQAAGTPQSVVVSGPATGLLGNTTYYFAIKTADEVPNVSPLTQVSVQTLPDNEGPAVVNNLAISNVTNHSVTLTWTAPGDDNNSGTAASYDIRYSTSTINAGNWASATLVTGEPIPAAAGTGQSLLIDNLTQNTTYYFAIKTSDEVPNTSGLSNVAAGQVLADTTAPGAVTSLTVAKAKSSALRLTWIASGDDGADRTATSYDVRYRTGGPVTEGNWASCTQVTGEPVPTQPGYHHVIWITGLSPSTTYYVGIKALDEVANASTIATASATTPAASNLTRPLLQPDDFEYLGAFKLPLTAYGQGTGFATAGIALRRVNGNLQFLTESGVGIGSTIYECNFPAWVNNPDPNTWNTAEPVHEWGAAVYGDPSCLLSNTQNLVWGLTYDQATGRLYYSYASGYNCSQENLPTLGCATLDGGPVAIGTWLSPSVHAQVMRGGSLMIPDWFADTYLDGRNLGVGFGGGFSGWASCSPGPALAAAHHPASTDTQLDTIPLLQYFQDDIAKWSTRDANYWFGIYFNLHNPVGNDFGYWASKDHVNAGIWIDLPDKQGLLYMSNMGQGHLWYDDGVEFADWLQPSWRVYDPADLAAVAQNNMEPWQPQHDSWPMPYNASGCAFDPQTRTLFVVVPGSYQFYVEWFPAVHGYHIRE